VALGVAAHGAGAYGLGGFFRSPSPHCSWFQTTAAGVESGAIQPKLSRAASDDGLWPPAGERELVSLLLCAYPDDLRADQLVTWDGPIAEETGYPTGWSIDRMDDGIDRPPIDFR